MNYKVSDKIKCPDCNSLITFYDEDCLKDYYHCQSCGSDIENESINENAEKYAKNSNALSNFSYEVDSGHIWIKFDDAIKLTQLQSDFFLSLVQKNIIPNKLLVDYAYINQFSGLSVKQMAKKMNKSENTITKLLRLGKLKGIKVAGKWIIYP